MQRSPLRVASPPPPLGQVSQVRAPVSTSFMSQGAGASLAAPGLLGSTRNLRLPASPAGPLPLQTGPPRSMSPRRSHSVSAPVAGGYVGNAGMVTRNFSGSLAAPVVVPALSPSLATGPLSSPASSSGFLASGGALKQEPWNFGAAGTSPAPGAVVTTPTVTAVAVQPPQLLKQVITQPMMSAPVAEALLTRRIDEINNKWQTRLASAREEVADLVASEEVRARQTRAIAELEQDFEEAVRQLKVQRKRIAQLEEELADVRGSEVKQAKQNIARSRQISELERELINCKVSKKEAEAVERGEARELQELQGKLFQLERELSELRVSQESYIQQNNAYSARIAQLEQDLQEARSSDGDSSRQSSTMRRRIVELELELADSKATEAVHNRQHTKHRTRITELEQELVDLKASEQRRVRETTIITQRNTSELQGQLGDLEMQLREARAKIAELEAKHHHHHHHVTRRVIETTGGEESVGDMQAITEQPPEAHHGHHHHHHVTRRVITTTEGAESAEAAATNGGTSQSMGYAGGLEQVNASLTDKGY